MLALRPDSADAVASWTPGYPLDLRATLAPLRRGPGDPTMAVAADGAVWRTSRMITGPVTYRLRWQDAGAVTAEVWGPGSGELIERLPALLGADDDPSGFAPEYELLRDAHRRHPGLRIGRTDRVFEALVPAVLEQKVTGTQAFGAWRRLVRQFGSAAPGPAGDRLRVVPDAETWRRVPSWDWHRAGVEPSASRTVVAAARVAPRLEECAALPAADAARRLRSLPGIGPWTVAEIAQRAFGDADALSVGDYHLSDVVGWALLGRPIDDAAMVELLEPVRPHRYRAVRLLGLTPAARKPRFGPRLTIQDHRGH